MLLLLLLYSYAMLVTNEAAAMIFAVWVTGIDWEIKKKYAFLWELFF